LINTEELMREYETLTEEYSSAKAHRTYLEEFRKSLHAILMKRAEVDGAKTVSAQERDAYANAEYVAHLKVIQEQVEREEKSRYHLKRLEMEYEIWRTHQANERYITR
jgi:hypothetical protein